MHYYKFSIGDYARSTRHLSNDEDLAFRRLLDMYYENEAPIPLETKWVSRRIRMDSAVVETVLSDMFTQTAEGWRHARCDAEIAEYQRQAERNRLNGKRGGRPKTVLNQQSQNPVGFQSEPGGNLNQEPITINHKPRTKDNIPPKPDGMDDQVWSDFLAVRKSKKAPLTATGLTRMANEAAKAGWTLEEAIAESVARGWQSFKAEWVRDRSHGQERNQHGRGKAKDGVNAALEDLIGFGSTARTADGHGTVSIEGGGQRALAAPSRLR